MKSMSLAHAAQTSTSNFQLPGCHFGFLMIWDDEEEARK
jgi:hypothetical protein